jgi:hypothetical protein
MAPVGTEHGDQQAEPSGDGTINLTGWERNETLATSQTRQQLSMPATPVVSVQVCNAWARTVRYCSAER